MDVQNLLAEAIRLFERGEISDSDLRKLCRVVNAQAKPVRNLEERLARLEAAAHEQTAFDASKKP